MADKEKSTEQLLNEIKQTNEIQRFLDANESQLVSKPLHEMLDEIIKSKALKKSEVVRASGLSRVYAYQIISGKKTPSRDKLIALCFGLKLDPDETDRLLKAVGYQPLYAKNKRDSIIIFALNAHKSVFYTNEVLFDNDLEILTV